MMYQPNTKALYDGTIADATNELARLIYEMAKAHDLPYVTACAFNDGGDHDGGSASVKRRSGEYTDYAVYELQGKEDSTDGQT